MHLPRCVDFLQVGMYALRQFVVWLINVPPRSLYETPDIARPGGQRDWCERNELTEVLPLYQTGAPCKTTVGISFLMDTYLSRCMPVTTAWLCTGLAAYPNRRKEFSSLASRIITTMTARKSSQQNPALCSQPHLHVHRANTTY